MDYCNGKSRFLNEFIANLAIDSTLEASGGKQKVINSMGRKRARKCLKVYFNFVTGFSAKEKPLYGCKVVISGNGWVVTSYPI